ncbi:MAG TPA: AAA family ATPase, partial [Candidatus Competibacteraceae bacterium]|nr:AAA family ATPase [Candidatus Competibacteraceae bacterium]
MKIERLYLKAYGAFSDHCLNFTDGPDFHVIYGPNEAGKSTTLRALIGLLFGIEDRTTDNFIHQNNRLRVGAALATAHDGRLTVMRRKGRKQTLFVLDETRGEECTDQPLAEDTLARWLGGLDENLYRALFGLDLDGLVHGSEALLEGKGEIGQSLFAAAAGLADLRQLSTQLETETAKLFLPRATAKPAINIALRELDEQRKRAREATVRSSAWEQADRARRHAEKKHTGLRAELARLREEQRRLSRVVAHLPLVAEREALRQEIAALASVPLLPADAQQQRIEVEERLRAAMSNQREAQAALDELRQQQSRRVVREALLSHAGDIERLHHAAKDYRGALERLPRIEAELDAARQMLIAQLTAIDPALTTESASIDWPEHIRALMPLPTVRARVQALIEEYNAWLIQDEQCAEQERKLSGALQQFRQALATQPAAMPFELLETAREQATGQGDLANQQAQLEREIAELETTLAREATALWSGPLDELITLRVPLLATVNELGDQYRQLAENERSLKDQDQILQRDLGERERELRGLAAAGEIVTHDQVRQARQHRDASWQRIRQACIECKDDANRRAMIPAEQSLPDVFESALREADRLADLLHADAKRATSVENLRQRIADMQQARVDLTQQLAILATERSQLDARWRVITDSLHQADLTPGAAVEWLQKQVLLVERAARLEALRRERWEIVSALAAARKTLDQALQNCGLPGLTEGETWSAALSRARTAIEQARQTATERANLIKSISQHEAVLSELAAKRSGLAEKHVVWQAQWNATVADLRLPPEALPAEARVRLEQWDQLAKLLSSLEMLTREARQEQAAHASFEEALTELAQAVAEPVDGREADRVAITLYEALSVARDADRLRKQVDADIEREQQRLGRAETAAAIQRDHLAELARRAGVESSDELASVEDRSQHKRRLSERVAEIEEQLVRGAARPLTDVLAGVEGEDLAAANARLDELETTLREYEAEVE